MLPKCICVIFNWPLLCSFACKIMTDLIKGDLSLRHSVTMSDVAVSVFCEHECSEKRNLSG